MRNSMIVQQDAQELMTRLLGWGCGESVENNDRRHNQYKALFHTVYREAREFSECKNGETSTVVDFGQRVTPLTSGHDTLEAAFTRAMTAHAFFSNSDPEGNKGKDDHVKCPIRKKQSVNLHSPIRIRSAPEYMCIHVNLFARNSYGQPIKNRNSMRIPDMLDLTQHVETVDNHPAAPLRYKLIDVVYQVGEQLSSGH
ncbi:uncharacterized protein M421DRAFT_210961 [Didymella exigua CBS 183.55]|uniref:USP domain-containing protein n=1 Tax=Didymella exigua CBS 183.55 TaxID=1150837 RepID=A0A6A5RH64_9PLEO|nr:uncharacterized protein M421DRAFT_210961 [Didymella exigua CBS 183.55]KAF1926580.1 hypothetical protein M421DRAFT_210961 [Didymella exigua CBS 183.55]